MKAGERGFLLLSSNLGDPVRKPLSTAQLRVLADRCWQLDISERDRQTTADDLQSIGYGRAMAERILTLLSQEDALNAYLAYGKRAGCVPLTRVSEGYPLSLRKRLGLDSPGVIWIKGDVTLLRTPMVALVGSRDLQPKNEEFAKAVGRQAALQGYTLVSGNARGADRTAQEACLAAGGNVICVVADDLSQHHLRENVLYISEEDFDAEFSAQRALSRNRVIHSLGEKTFVAQCRAGMGGTWDGTVKNLRFGWSDVFCFHDGSEGIAQLHQMGAQLIECSGLRDISSLCSQYPNFFDQ